MAALLLCCKRYYTSASASVHLQQYKCHCGHRPQRYMHNQHLWINQGQLLTVKADQKAAAHFTGDFWSIKQVLVCLRLALCELCMLIALLGYQDIEMMFRWRLGPKSSSRSSSMMLRSSLNSPRTAKPLALSARSSQVNTAKLLLQLAYLTLLNAFAAASL